MNTPHLQVGYLRTRDDSFTGVLMPCLAKRIRSSLDIQSLVNLWGLDGFIGIIFFVLSCFLGGALMGSNAYVHLVNQPHVTSSQCIPLNFHPSLMALPIGAADFSP